MKNWLLVTNERVEFKKTPVEVQDLSIILEEFHKDVPEWTWKH